MQDCNPVTSIEIIGRHLYIDAPAELGDAHRARSRDCPPLSYCKTNGRSGAAAVVRIMSGRKRSRVRFPPVSSPASRDARSRQRHGETGGLESFDNGADGVW